MESQPANLDLARARAYHDATKHSDWSIRATPHYLDWDNQPLPFKIYASVDPILLPREAGPTGASALSAIARRETARMGERIPALEDLARLLYFSAGITKEKTSPGSRMYFRAASCTGALYEFELYVVCGDLPDLKAGLYHFGPGDFSLRLLRPGDYRGWLVRATGDEPSVARAPVVIVCAGTYWRNAWKYRARTYRHFGWDNGTILANLLAMASALEFPAGVVCGFVDSDVNRLLDLDTDREVAFSMVSVGRANAPAPAPPSGLPKLNLPTIPLSKSEVDYPELRAIHEASSLETPRDVQEWRTPAAAGAPALPPEFRAPDTGDAIEQVILRRGSSRRFGRTPITREQLNVMLRSSTQGVPADFLAPGAQINDIYAIVNAVEDVRPGAYYFRRGEGAMECLKEGDFRSDARRLGLGQDLPGDAAAAVFFLADLEQVLGRLGNRGYRVAQLEAGIIGGKLYLAAYAQRLGATGLTFFDDDVTNFFSPHAKGKSAIFLVALGKGRNST